MTELSGMLDGVGLPAIVRFLGGLKKTGCLRLSQQDWHGELYLMTGLDPTQLGPNAPALPQNIEDRPDFMTAARQQLGLKIEASKAPVEVLVIDKVIKPTEN